MVIGDLNQETGKATLSEIEEQGAAERAIFMATDVAEEADIEALVNSAITNFSTFYIFSLFHLIGLFFYLKNIQLNKFDMCIGTFSLSILPLLL